MPFFGAFFFLLAAEATLVTALNAFLALLMVPFLPYEVLPFTIFIPFDTALLNLLCVYLVKAGLLVPTIGASKSAKVCKPCCTIPPACSTCGWITS